ncbi:MAG: phosphatase PAP2 family protein [Lachnospiraceae bacterium]|nr:phosphatase PAP2 family protein [Lachnospiraceae bacterium]
MKQMKNYLIENRQVILMPLAAFLVNVLVYGGGRLLASGKKHYDFTLRIDELTPFIPWTMLIYWGCFVFWILVYLRMASLTRKEAGHFFLMHLIGELTCFLFFVFLPTTNVRPAVDGADLWSALVRLQYRADAADNLFPSIHCMISWICWVDMRKQKSCPQWARTASLLTALAVFISTLTLKQHVIVDVISAVIVGEAANQLAKLPVLLEPFCKLWERMLRKTLPTD